MSDLRITAYNLQARQWPAQGRQVLAQFNAESIVVYQAFRPSIGQFAAEHGQFGDEFSLTRMSWIKTNFLWMMYRCGWATKKDQQCVLAITIRRSGFDRFLEQAVASSHSPGIYRTCAEWQQALSQSDVRLQWDPDHGPTGGSLRRRAIQIGLRGEPLRQYAQEEIVKIEDVTSFVHAQAEFARPGRWDELKTPQEDVYPLTDSIARNISVFEEPEMRRAENSDTIAVGGVEVSGGQ